MCPPVYKYRFNRPDFAYTRRKSGAHGFPLSPVSRFQVGRENASPRIISRNCAHRRVHYGGRAGSARKISRPCFSSVSWLNISNFHASPCYRSNCRVHGSCNVVEPELLITRRVSIRGILLNEGLLARGKSYENIRMGKGGQRFVEFIDPSDASFD